VARVLLENVTKIFDNKIVAVDNITLKIADKEFMVIVGPSGCGKTTILRMIAGLEKPTSGKVVIGDTVVNDISPKDRNIAMVFQNYALYPHMTVFQNMAFGLKLRKYSKAEMKKRVEEIAELLGIKQMLKRKPEALSGGQRQRVALGRAIVHNPRAFLFDEPLSNLDAKLRVITRTELKALHRKLSVTAIYVTHDQSEAMTLGDRICVMYNGVIQQTAPPMEVYNRPINKFVAGFLGTPQMNFLKGQIAFEQSMPKFVMSDSEIALPVRLKSNLSAYKDSEMVLGIRPEHLSMMPINGQSKNRISAMIDVVEPLGNRTDIYLSNKSGQKFIANTETHTKVKANDVVTTYVDIKHVHIFETVGAEQNVGLNT